MTVFLAIYGVAAFVYHQSSVRPLEDAMGYLARAESSQTPEELKGYVTMAKSKLPQSGNPVWIFPTAKTDFAIMQATLDDMISRADHTAALDRQGEEYVRNMYDMHASLKTVQRDIYEACYRLCQ